MKAEVSDRTMTTEPHDEDAPGHAGAVAHHVLHDHGDDHGHDDHAHGEEPLGPIDVAAWSAGVVGVLIGVAIAACFVLATSLPA
jgi:ABC-type Zn2+ transport system substrate-binding protein/surface adhesin